MPAPLGDSSVPSPPMITGATPPPPPRPPAPPAAPPRRDRPPRAPTHASVRFLTVVWLICVSALYRRPV